jgi:hypothetical protein
MGIPEVGKRFGEYLGRFHRKAGQTRRTYIQNHRHLQIRVEEAIKAADKKNVESRQYRRQLTTLLKIWGKAPAN